MGGTQIPDKGDSPPSGSAVEFHETKEATTGGAMVANEKGAAFELMPITTKDLYEAFYADKDAWLEKTVTVVGFYHGRTHSKTTDQIRIDLKTDRFGKTLVGCFIDGSQSIPQDLGENPGRVVMRGVVTYPFFGQVILKDAQFIQRFSSRP